MGNERGNKEILINAINEEKNNKKRKIHKNRLMHETGGKLN